MGRQTGVFIVAFTSSHIALFLTFACVYTHYWIEALPPKHEFNSTNIQNVSEISFSKGLFRFCYENLTRIYYPKIVSNVTSYDKLLTETETCSSVNDIPWRVTGYNVSGIEPWFSAVQGTYTLGFVTLIIATVLLYIFACIQKFRGSLVLITATMLAFVFAGVLCLIGFIIVGARYKDEITLKNITSHELILGWIYYVGIPGIIIMFIGAAACVYNWYLVKSGEAKVPYVIFTANF